MREKLDDPKYSSWFIKFKDYRGPSSNDSYHVPACDWFGNATHPPKCSGFYHDQEQARDTTVSENFNTMITFTKTIMHTHVCLHWHLTHWFHHGLDTQPPGTERPELVRNCSSDLIGQRNDINIFICQWGLVPGRRTGWTARAGVNATAAPLTHAGGWKMVVVAAAVVVVAGVNLLTLENFAPPSQTSARKGKHMPMHKTKICT